MADARGRRGVHREGGLWAWTTAPRVRCGGRAGGDGAGRCAGRATPRRARRHGEREARGAERRDAFRRFAPSTTTTKTETRGGREAEIDPTRWATRVIRPWDKRRATPWDKLRTLRARLRRRTTRKKWTIRRRRLAGRAPGGRPARAEKKSARDADAAASAPPRTRRRAETASRGHEVVGPRVMTRRCARARDAPRGVVRRDAGKGGGGGGGAARGVTRRFFSLLFATSFLRSRCRHLPASART